jgi:hypothetical protein
VNIDNQIIQSVLRKAKGEVSPILWLDSNSTVFRATYREFDNQRCCRHRGSLNLCLGQLATNPHLTEVWNRGVQDWESLKEPDRQTFQAFMLQLFHIFEELYYQQLERHLDPRLWRHVETPMRDLINACPGIQAWWREYSRWFSAEL